MCALSLRVDSGGPEVYIYDRGCHSMGRGWKITLLKVSPFCEMPASPHQRRAMARRKLSSILKELDEIAHQADDMAREFTGEGIFARIKRTWQDLQQSEPVKEDPYKILDLEPNCIPSDIIYRYRQLAKRYHPDNRDTGDEAKFKKIQKAYEDLCQQRGIR